MECKFDELFGTVDDDKASIDSELTDAVRSCDSDDKCANEETDDEDINDNIIVLKDDNGNDIRFEFLDLIQYQNKEYVILLSVDETEKENASEVVIHHLEEGGESTDEESYCSVDDEEILNAVFEIFKEKLKDEFDFDVTVTAREK